MVFTTRWSDYAPGLSQFRSYRLGWLRGDIAGELAVARALSDLARRLTVTETCDRVGLAER